MVIKVGINGFGRIGRVIFRTCLQSPDIELSAINDPAIDIEYICYLIKFDSTHGKFKGNVSHTENEIHIDDDLLVKVFREKHPHSVPWSCAGVQYVIEASGMFTSLDKASGHLSSDGVKRVIVTAPSVDVPMVILGVNDNKFGAEQRVLSCASSTLYCLAPIVKVLEDNYGVTEGFITSIHAMTPSLKPLDGLCLRGKHWRDYRSIHQNIIPASTGACKALSKIIPQVKDKMSGLAFRVPIVNVSVLDLTIRLDTNTSIQDIINSVSQASNSFLQNIIKISNEEAVSSDFSGDSYSCILDVDSSLQLKPNFFKIICWYENEYSYACRVLDSIFFSERQLNRPSRLPCKLTYAQAKIMKKQDKVQQTDHNCKEVAIECNVAEVPKVAHTTSQDTTIKRKPIITRPGVLRKPLSSHNSGTTTAIPTTNRDTKKRNELFKIWNDNNDAQKNAARQNRNALFHSCIALNPKQTEKTDCMKAQERLENVKKEFSKMVNITEKLLKKSYTKKMQLETATNSLEGVKLSSNGGLKDALEEPTKYINPPANNSAYNVCGDYKPKLGSSPTVFSGEEANRCSSSERNESITGGVRNKGQKSSLVPSKEEVPLTVRQNSFKNYNKKITNQNTVTNKVNDASKKTRVSYQEQITKTVNNSIGRMNNIFQVQYISTEHKGVDPNVSDTYKAKDSVQKEFEVKNVESSGELEILCGKDVCNTEISTENVIKDPESPDKLTYTDFNNYLHNKNRKMQMIDEVLKKRNILLVNNQKDSSSEANLKGSSVESERSIVDIDARRRNSDLNKQILERLNRLVPRPTVVISDNTSACCSTNTVTTISTGDNKRRKPDLYDKLDSASATDSNNSFEINERKSQVIHITDLTNSLDDLARLDKICRIIEISDELSDRLFSTLDTPELTGLEQKKWSFKDLCERIQLDEFCDKVFGEGNKS